MSEWLLEFLANMVKGEEYYVVDDIPKGLLKEYEKMSKEEAERANQIYNFNHSNH